jgi:hypothetical protein
MPNSSDPAEIIASDLNALSFAQRSLCFKAGEQPCLACVRSTARRRKTGCRQTSARSDYQHIARRIFDQRASNSADRASTRTARTTRADNDETSTEIANFARDHRCGLALSQARAGAKMVQGFVEEAAAQFPKQRIERLGLIAFDFALRVYAREEALEWNVIGMNQAHIGVGKQARSREDRLPRRLGEINWDDDAAVERRIVSAGDKNHPAGFLDNLLGG